MQDGCQIRRRLAISSEKRERTNTVRKKTEKKEEKKLRRLPCLAGRAKKCLEYSSLCSHPRWFTSSSKATFKWVVLTNLNVRVCWITPLYRFQSGFHL